MNSKLMLCEKTWIDYNEKDRNMYTLAECIVGIKTQAKTTEKICQEKHIGT